MQNTYLSPSFTLTEQNAEGNRAQVVIEPLEQGYGHTLGNALRRVLLTSLPGAAPVMMRVAGSDHPFATMDGVTEDVLELSLNMKQVRVRASGTEDGVLRLKVKGPKTVTAADLECSAGLEIINGDQYLATVASGKTLEFEVRVASGVGYLPADDTQSNTIGDIALDALFSPVITVSYKIESTRVGRRTDYDRLVMDVVTDGTLTPITAVREAARILSVQFNQVLDPAAKVDDTATAVGLNVEPELARLTVEELELPTRIANALRKGGFETVGDLLRSKREIVAKVKNLGDKSLDVILEGLAKKGLTIVE